MERSLSTAQVARRLGLPEARVREWLRAGLTPGAPARRGRGRSHRVAFQELVVLYAARGLLEQGVPAARVRRALVRLTRELGDRPLSGLRIFADGRQVAVRDGGRSWQPETGQILLDFTVDDVARLAAEPAALPVSGDDEHTGEAPGPRASTASERATREFEIGLDLEERDPAAAAAAYRRALALAPEDVDVRVNLGRLALEAGDVAEATRLWREALDRRADDPVIHFNLALALEDAGDADAARAGYVRALALDPEFADAHFNLAQLSEKQGLAADAVRHYGAYRKLTSG